MDNAGEPQLKFERQHRPGGTEVTVRDVTIGGHSFVIIAGPCAVENRLQLMVTATAVRAAGAHILRGGAYKPRTSPYAFRGLKEEGLMLLSEARRTAGLPVVTEVLDPRHVGRVSEYADMLQIGSRNMQNYSLLEEVGQGDRPVLLKRGMAATIDEFLFAAEYVLARGNDRVVLCERGIRTFEPATRNTLDLSAVPLLKRRTHLPVVVDPSHGCGLAWMVPHLARAAVAIGADGLLVEVHHQPEVALSDGAQSLTVPAFDAMVRSLRPVAAAVGRDLPEPASLQLA